MKNSWQILTLLLAIATCTLAIKVTLLDSKEDTTIEVLEPDTQQIILDNIMTRSSVRKYTSQEIEKEKIDLLLKAGMAAPTAGNRQPWELMVITDKEVLAAIPPMIKGAHMADKAPLAICVLGSPEKALVPDYWIQDCSAVTENILLAAHGMGLGAVWCGAFPDNNTGKVEGMSKLLNLPEGTYALNVIVIGYPDAEAVVKDKWDASKVHYNTY